MRVKNILLCLIGVVITITTSYALLHPGFFRVHDYTHAARISELLRSAQDGHLPVRWTPNFGYGWGMPLFEFYAPLPYYTGALLYWLGTDIVTTVKVLYLFCTIGTLLGAFLLGKSLYGRAGGVVTAAALTLAPYRAVNLFVRGSLSEAWAIMAMPWLFWGVMRTLRGERYGWQTVLAASLVLFLSHNITTMFFVPISAVFAVAYAIFWYRVNFFRRALIPLLKIAGTMVLAVGGALFYLLPALTEKDFTRVQAIFEGYFHYAIHFLYIRQFFLPNWKYGGSVGGPQDDLSFFLGYGQLVALGLGVIAAGWYLARQLRRHQSLWEVLPKFGMTLFFGSMLVVALFMTLFKSQFIWERLPFLAVAQFPWRWLSVASLFLALTGGAVTWFLPRRIVRWGVAAGLVVVMVIGNWQFFRPENYLDEPDSFYYTDPVRIRSHMSSILNDYIPKQVIDNPPVVTQSLWKVNDLVMTSDRLEEKDLAVLPRVNRVHEKLWSVRFANATTIQFGVADFPGWQAFLDGKPLEKRLGDVGNIAVDVPSGEHQLGLQLTATPLRAASDLISLLSWGVIAVILLLWQAPRHRYD